MAWSEDEESFLRKNASILTAPQIAEKLQKTPESVRAKRARLHLQSRQEPNHRWTPQQEQLLKEHHGDMTVKELSSLLQRLGVEKQPETVRARCKKLGIKPMSASRHAWTEEEERFLKMNQDDMTNREIAMHLGIPESAVRTKRYKPDMVYEMKRVTPWKHRMLEKIDELGKSIYDVSCELYEKGVPVEVRADSHGKMAVFTQERR